MKLTSSASRNSGRRWWYFHLSASGTGTSIGQHIFVIGRNFDDILFGSGQAVLLVLFLIFLGLCIGFEAVFGQQRIGVFRFCLLRLLPQSVGSQLAVAGCCRSTGFAPGFQQRRRFALDSTVGLRCCCWPSSFWRRGDGGGQLVVVKDQVTVILFKQQQQQRMRKKAKEKKGEAIFIFLGRPVNTRAASLENLVVEQSMNV